MELAPSIAIIPAQERLIGGPVATQYVSLICAIMLCISEGDGSTTKTPALNSGDVTDPPCPPQ